MNLFVTVPFLLTLLVATLNGDNPCIYKDDKGVIDLTSLGHTDGTPAFLDITPNPPIWKYSFNPCKPFSEGTFCQNVAVCQVPINPGQSFILAKHDSAAWVPPTGFGGSLLLTYVYLTKKVSITMKCTMDTEANVLEMNGESPPETYKMTLSSKCACYDGCKNKPGPDPDKPKKSLGGGAIVIILVVVLLFVYLVVFMSFNKFKRQATGLDILPHRSFWISLPGYSRDGIIFVFQKLTGKGTAYQTV